MWRNLCVPGTRTKIKIENELTMETTTWAPLMQVKATPCREEHNRETPPSSFTQSSFSMHWDKVKNCSLVRWNKSWKSFLQNMIATSHHHFSFNKWINVFYVLLWIKYSFVPAFLEIWLCIFLSFLNWIVTALGKKLSLNLVVHFIMLV